MAQVRILHSSFRDPSGFVYWLDQVLYRQVNPVYRSHYEHLMNSGLYGSLVNSGALLPHDEVSLGLAATREACRVLRPEPVRFISYPYEWSFTQLKDAALLALEIQKESLNNGMSLKDCSAFNIQFRKGKPVFIDTLSFELCTEGLPWKAYRQFCQHFLAPLALMSYRDVRLGQLSRIYIDGIPLDLASALLPLRSFFRFSLFSHLHLHAKSQRHFERKTGKPGFRPMSRRALLALVNHLESTVSSLKWQPMGTEWVDYYSDTNYDENSFARKKELVGKFLEQMNPRPEMIWDLGANTGEFSRIAARLGSRVIAFDHDPACVERNYLLCRKNGETSLLPLLLDLANPSPALGWGCQERSSLLERGPAEAVLALALIHHLAISNNVPMSKLADFFATICRTLIIEFVPKSDSQVQRLLSTREDTFPTYTQAEFEVEFSRYFMVRQSERIGSSERTLYWMDRRAVGEE